MVDLALAKIIGSVIIILGYLVFTLVMFIIDVNLGLISLLVSILISVYCLCIILNVHNAW